MKKAPVEDIYGFQPNHMMCDAIGYCRLNGNYIGKRTVLQGLEGLFQRPTIWLRTGNSNRTNSGYVEEIVAENVVFLWKA
jgi:hypothetical protein